MSAYIMAFVRINDFENYQREYMTHAHPIVTKYGGKALAVTDNVKIMEGKLPEGRMVIVEFPSMENAEAFYADPDYQPLIEVRKKYTDSHAAIFDQGFAATAA